MTEPSAALTFHFDVGRAYFYFQDANGNEYIQTLATMTKLRDALNLAIQTEYWEVRA